MANKAGRPKSEKPLRVWAIRISPDDIAYFKAIRDRLSTQAKSMPFSSEALIQDRTVFVEALRALDKKLTSIGA